MLFKSNGHDRAREYDEIVYRHQREGAVRSARYALPKVNAELQPQSSLDVGCGAGTQDIVGIDGDYVGRSVLMFDESHFCPTDISRHRDLGRTFHLVQWYCP